MPVCVRNVIPSPAAAAAHIPLRLLLVNAMRQGIFMLSRAAVAALRIRQGASKTSNGRRSVPIDKCADIEIFCANPAEW